MELDKFNASLMRWKIMEALHEFRHSPKPQIMHEIILGKQAIKMRQMCRGEFKWSYLQLKAIKDNMHITRYTKKHYLLAYVSLEPSELWPQLHLPFELI